MRFDGIEKRVIDPGCARPEPDEQGRHWVLIYQHKSGDRVQSQWAPVTKNAADVVEKLNLVLECEILTTGEIALYCHFLEEEEYGCDIATNGPGDNSPSNVLTKMIMEKLCQTSTP